MKKFGLMLIVIGLIALTLIPGCARSVKLEPAVKHELSFKDFNRIEAGLAHDSFSLGNWIDIPVELDVVKADSYKVNLTANQNIFDYIKLTQSGDSLIIAIDSNRIANKQAVIKVEIAMPELEGLKLTSGNFRANVFSTAAVFEANVTGASDLDIDIQTGQVFFKIASSSDVNISGTSADFTAEVSGASNLKSSLKAANTRLIISSSADVTVKGSTKELTAELSGASELDLDMQADTARLSLSSSSDVKGSLVTADLSVQASGASEIRLTGSAVKAQLSAVSSSEIFMGEMPVKNARVVLSGASEGRLNVVDYLDVDISGASDLEYRGNPRMGDIEINGDSEINHIQN